MLLGDLKRYDLLEDWKDTLQNRGLEMLHDGGTDRPQRSHGKTGEGKQGSQKDRREDYQSLWY